MGFVGNNEVNKRFEAETAERRRQSDEADRRLKENAEREKRGLPSLEVEERNAAVRARQQKYFEQRQREGQSQQSVAQLLTDDQLKARDAALLFVSEEPEYLRTSENLEAMAQAITDQALSPFDPNSYHRVFRQLRDAGKLTLRKARTEQQSSTAQQPKPEVLPPGAEQAPDGRVYSAAEIEAMSADQYARAFRLQRGHQYKVKTSNMGWQYVSDESASVGLPHQ